MKAFGFPSGQVQKKGARAMVPNYMKYSDKMEQRPHGRGMAQFSNEGRGSISFYYNEPEPFKPCKKNIQTGGSQQQQFVPQRRPGACTPTLRDPIVIGETPEYRSRTPILGPRSTIQPTIKGLAEPVTPPRRTFHYVQSRAFNLPETVEKPVRKRIMTKPTHMGHLLEQPFASQEKFTNKPTSNRISSQIVQETAQSNWVARNINKRDY